MSEPNRSQGSRGPVAVSRREFLKSVGTVATLSTGAGASLETSTEAGEIADISPAVAETAVARLHDSLAPDQRRILCFPFDHPLRSRIANNWAIVPPSIGDFSREQQALCREIFERLCSEEGHTGFLRQMADDGGGFERYHVAIFGESGTKQPFEWVLTGRHATLRVDGHSVEGAAAVGPIFLGHGAAGGPRNVWWGLARQAHEILASLDDSEKARAVVGKKSRVGRLGDKILNATGLAVAGLDDERKSMVRKLLDDTLGPFRVFEARSIRECLAGPAGADNLRLTFYEEEGMGAHGVWKLEGPAFSWYFHGVPHVHAWLHIDRPT